MQNVSISSPEMFELIDILEALELWMMDFNDLKNRIEGNTNEDEDMDDDKDNNGEKNQKKLTSDEMEEEGKK